MSADKNYIQSNSRLLSRDLPLLSRDLLSIDYEHYALATRREYDRN